MLRRALPLTVALVLAIGPALAANDPGARAPIGVGAGNVNDVALADTNWLAIATQDPSGRISVPPAPSADVWQLYNLVGSISRQAGDADIDACDGASTTLDDCQTHATNVAISADGTRMVVASVADDGNPVLTFVREASGNLNAVRAGAGSVADLEMSDDGQTIVLLTNTGTANVVGHVYLLSWASGSSTVPTVLWSDDLSGGGVSDAGLSPDGQSIAVLQGGTHHRYKRASNVQVTDTNFAGTGNDAAVANAGRHLGVSGSSDGWLYFYTDDSPAGSSDLRFREVTNSVDAVAISSDGTLVVAGNAAGDLWAYSFDPVLLKTGTVRKASLGSPIREVALANDGKTLAVAYGNNVAQYGILDTSLVQLWSQALTASSGDVAIDANGDHVAAANGTKAIVYDAKHLVTVSAGASPTTKPGMLGTFTASFTNTGNRVESGSLALQAPTGWAASLASTSVQVLPGATATVQVNYTVPNGEPAGAKDFTLLSNLGAAGSKTTGVKVNVPTVEAWSLQVDGPASLGLKAGASNAFAVNVTNGGNVPGTPALAATVSPAGWTVGMAGNDGPLAAGASRIVTVTVTAPATAADGAQGHVTLALPGATGSPLELFATVGATFGVALDGPDLTEAARGGTTTLHLTVRNLGNAPDVYEVTYGTLPTGWSATVRSSGMAVGPGGTADIPVDLEVPKAAATTSAVELSFQARSTSDASKSDGHNVLVQLPSEGGDGSSSTSPGKGGSKGSPGLGLLAVVLALAAVAAVARRR